MTEVKHTSQEWYFDRHFVRALPKTRTGTPVDIARIYKGGKTEEEFNANAHLIAAAPDMEKALEGLLQNYLDLANSGDCGFWNPEEEEEVQVARAALAKARGEETPIPKCIHCDEEAMVQLHGDDLCETHADDWMRGEGRVATKGEEK